MKRTALFLAAIAALLLPTMALADGEGAVNPGVLANRSILAGCLYRLGNISPAVGDMRQMGLECDTSGVLLSGDSTTPSHIAGAATTVVRSGAGVLHTLTINTKGTGSTATVYDNTAGSGAVLAIVDTTVGPVTLTYDVNFNTGLTVVTTGTLSDLTVSYR